MAHRDIRFHLINQLYCECLRLFQFYRLDISGPYPAPSVWLAFVEAKKSNWVWSREHLYDRNLSKNEKKTSGPVVFVFLIRHPIHNEMQSIDGEEFQRSDDDDDNDNKHSSSSSNDKQHSIHRISRKMSCLPRLRNLNWRRFFFSLFCRCLCHSLWINRC